MQSEKNSAGGPASSFEMDRRFLDLETNLKDFLKKEITLQMQPVVDMIGKVNDEETGGSGLNGKLVRLERKVSAIYDMKHTATGLILACTLFGALIWLGFKELIKS